MYKIGVSPKCSLHSPSTSLREENTGSEHSAFTILFSLERANQSVNILRLAILTNLQLSDFICPCEFTVVFTGKLLRT